VNDNRIDQSQPSRYHCRMEANVTSPLLERISAVRARRAANAPANLPPSGWRQVAGTVEDDELFREAARLGETWRKEQNQRR